MTFIKRLMKIKEMQVGFEYQRNELLRLILKELKGNNGNKTRGKRKNT